jgi:hypothetical protein
MNKQIGATKWIPREYPWEEISDIADTIINEICYRKD